MPNIHTYQSPIDRVTPDQAGSAAFAQEGRRIAYVGHQMGEDIGSAVADVSKETDKVVGQQELSDLSAKAANMFATATQSWNQTVTQADPGDTSVGAKWQQHVLQPQLDSFGEDAMSTAGQEFAQRFRGEMMNHFGEKIVADTSALAGSAAKTNFDTTANNYSQAAYADPTTMETAIKLNTASAETLLKNSPALTPEATAMLRQGVAQKNKEIAISAAKAMAENNPAAFQKEAASGRFDNYLNGEEMATLNTYAIHQQKAAELQQRSDVRFEQEQQKQVAGQQAAKLATSVIDPDNPSAPLKVPGPDYYKQVIALGQHPGASAGMVKSLLSLGKTVTDGDANMTNPQTYHDFAQRLSLPTGDPNALTAAEVIQARADHQLSDKDYTFFHSAVSKAASDPQFKQAQRQLNQLMVGQRAAFFPKGFLGVTDPAASQRYYAFQSAAQEQLEEDYKNGSWKQALTPGSPNFIGRLALPYLPQQKGGGVSIYTPPVRLTGSNAQITQQLQKLPKGAQFIGPDGKLYTRK